MPEVYAAGVNPWWERFPPRYAAPELAADFRSGHGVRVEVHED